MRLAQPGMDLKSTIRRDSESPLYTLQTASSTTLRIRDSPQPLAGDCPLIKTNTQGRPSDRNKSTPGHSLLTSLVELSNRALYGPIVHGLAVKILLYRLRMGHVDGMAETFVALPILTVERFLKDLTRSEHLQWLRSEKFRGALIGEICSGAISSYHVAALLHPYDRPASAPLFRPGPYHAHEDATCGDGVDHLLTYLGTSCQDYMPDVLEGKLRLRASDETLHAVSTYLNTCPAFRRDTFLERLLGRIASPTCRAAQDRARAALAAAVPELRTECATTSTTLPRDHWQEHPASAFLYCAIRLAERDATVCKDMLAQGLLQVVERVYDGEIAGVCSLGLHVLHRLAYVLLRTVSDCCDLGMTTLVEELRGDIIIYRRRLDRRYFAPEVWEIRDD
ncbi:hypothetical protein PsYK624_048710 [Phanerochaete sordida]|uniref:Uncharacterized protein n=1 Tax=Phanerochaete sordida TaxID=48140 RepID=A0A9P3G6K2_9APHY|nr:hypothetical protein PsYK624_048710 [Phanerochaete sordida]